jgi:2-polyprenyl-3-methyl-5-hydroxy-6-metoxy-1,4-benzoquinol methylase
MEAEKSNMYSSGEAYLKVSGVMKNEVTMWSVAAGILVQEIVRKEKKSIFGENPADIGLVIREKLRAVSVLDMCCGPGTFVNYLALVYPDITVTGIDVNAAFIDYASRRFGGHGWEFIKADARAFDLRRTFDFVTAASAYHHVEDEFKVDFLLNARKHLVDGGKVMLCEQFLPHYSNEDARIYAINEYYELLRKYCSKGDRSKEAIQAADETHQLELSGHEEYKVHHAAFEAHAQAAGFEIELDIPVWQPKEFIEDKAGSFVILLKPLSL